MKRFLQRTFTIKINWGLILAFAAFWTFGWNGSLPRGGYSEIVFSPLLFLLVCVQLAYSEKKAFQDKLAVTGQDLVSAGCYLIVLLVLLLPEMRYPIHGDEALHAADAANGLFWLVRRFGVPEEFLTLPFYRLLIAFNWLAVIVWAVLGFLFFKFWPKKKVWAVLILFIAFCVCRRYFPYVRPFPPLRTFPVWLTSTLFFSTEFSYRLAGLLALVLLQTVLQSFARERWALGSLTAWFFGFAATSFPLLLLVVTVTEQSIWTTLVWTLFGISLITAPSLEKFQWIRWSSLLALGILMRQPMLPAAGAFLILFSYRLYSARSLTHYQYWLAVTAPFLLPFSVLLFDISGSHFNSAFSADSGVPSASTRFMTGEVFRVIWRDVGFLGVILYLFAFFPRQNRLWKGPALFLISLAGIVLFSSVRTFGESRYQAEYFLTFSIIGIFNLVSWTSGYRRTVALSMTILAGFNIGSYFRHRPGVARDDGSVLFSQFGKVPQVKILSNGTSLNPKDLKDYHSFVTHDHITSRRRNFADALARAKELPLDKVHDATSLYIPMNWILEGYPISHIQRMGERAEKHFPWCSIPCPLADSIHADRQIDYVFIDSDMIYRRDVTRFGELGWKLDEIFLEPKYQTAVYLLKRK